VVSGGETSWHGYARHVIEFARAAGQVLRVRPEDIAAVPTSAFPTAARRPANSRMETRKLQAAFGLHLPDWRVGVDRMLREVLR
jgi:dTDP-4-dehydrorhamnose reductase